jgi:hypothetical protein
MSEDLLFDYKTFITLLNLYDIISITKTNLAKYFVYYMGILWSILILFWRYL